MSTIGDGRAFRSGNEEPQFGELETHRAQWCSDKLRQAVGDAPHEDEFNDLIVYTRNRIALIYHRYDRACPQATSRDYSHTAEDRGYDPFYLDQQGIRNWKKRKSGSTTSVSVSSPIYFRHYSKITLSEYDRLGGEEGF